LKADAATIGALSVVSSLASLAGHRLFGPLTDRWGPRRVQVLTGLLIPLAPLGWLVAQVPWHTVPMHVVGGFLWAGYGTAAFNFQLLLTPPDRRPSYAAIAHVVALGALAGGAAIGGIIAQTWGYKATFLVTSIGRLIGALVFARFVRLRD
jgi:predicted MFS family arabinose efflux permease